MSPDPCPHGCQPRVNCVVCCGWNEVTIHYCGWSQQPDIYLACGRWTTPSWHRTVKVDVAGIYEEGDGELYTFEHRDDVTCPDCLSRMKEGRTHPE